MPDDISTLAAAFFATWPPDAPPLLRAALIDLLTSVRAAERGRCAEIADRTRYEPMDYIDWSPGPAADDRAEKIAATIRTVPRTAQ